MPAGGSFNALYPSQRGIFFAISWRVAEHAAREGGEMSGMDAHPDGDGTYSLEHDALSTQAI